MILKSDILELVILWYIFKFIRVHKISDLWKSVDKSQHLIFVGALWNIKPLKQSDVEQLFLN